MEERRDYWRMGTGGQGYVAIDWKRDMQLCVGKSNATDLLVPCPTLTIEAEPTLGPAGFSILVWAMMKWRILLQVEIRLGQAAVGAQNVMRGCDLLQTTQRSWSGSTSGGALVALVGMRDSDNGRYTNRYVWCKATLRSVARRDVLWCCKR